MRLFGYEIMKAPSRSTEAVKVRLPSFYSWVSSTYGALAQEDHTLQVQNYKSWVYICASKNAQAVAASKLRLYVAKRKSLGKMLIETRKIDRAMMRHLDSRVTIHKYMNRAEDVEEVMEHPFLDLMNNVNNFSNKFDMFELTELYQELTGNAYWYIAKNALGVPAELWVLPPQYMRVIPDKQEFIKGYVYVCGTEKIPYEPHEIIHFKFPSPTSYLYGYSPLAAVGLAVDLNKDIGIFEKTLFQNMGRPEGILSTEQSLTDPEFERLKMEWNAHYGGVKKVGKTIVLEKGLEYTPITFSPKDLSNMAGRRLIVEEIAGAYGVPMSKISTSDVNLANAYVGEVQYQRDTIEPRLKRIEEKMNEKLLAMFDDNLFCAFDSPVPQDQEFRLRERTSNLTSGYSSINLERQKDGEESVTWGEFPLISSALSPFTGEESPSPPPPDPNAIVVPSSTLPKPISSNGESQLGVPSNPEGKGVDAERFVREVVMNMKKSVQELLKVELNKQSELG